MFPINCPDSYVINFSVSFINNIIFYTGYQFFNNLFLLFYHIKNTLKKGTLLEIIFNWNNMGFTNLIYTISRKKSF